MLSILFTLEYKCTAKFGYSNSNKIEFGRDCPDDVACSKMTPSDYKKAYGSEAEFKGVYAVCAVEDNKEECEIMCKVDCKENTKGETYKYVGAGYADTGSYSFRYYCPKGQQKYNGSGLSTGAIVGIVIACIVVVAVIVFCICYFLVCKNGCGKKSQSPVQQMASQKA